MPAASPPADLPPDHQPQPGHPRLQGRGRIATAFDIRVQNDVNRFHLVQDVVDRLPQLDRKAGYDKQALRDKLIEHREYICQYGKHLPEIGD